MPISIPVIDMVEIGAGGGSLAHVDGMRQIRVGPESAGSEPGPACYDRGGERPGVTDADLVLGKLDPDNFAGGSITLHPDNSKTALTVHVGNTLEMGAVEAAFGVAEVVDENMANAARVHAVENGEDLSEYTMIAFGGAAPLHAGRLCEKLGVERLLVPPGAGVGSAIGFLRAPFSFEANRSVYMKLSDFDADKIKHLLSDLKAEATGFVRTCDEVSPILSEFKVYMRYTGQGWEIPIDLTESQAMNPDAATFEARFEEDYAKLFGRPVAGIDIEITVWSVNATTPPEQVTQIAETDGSAPVALNGTRKLFDASIGSYLDAHVIDRATMKTGQRASGPAALTEAETTIIVPASRDAIRQPDGCIDLVKKGAAQ
jgi:N-methylhydantoinase A